MISRILNIKKYPLNMKPERWEFFDEKYLDKIVKLNKNILHFKKSPSLISIMG